MLRGGCCECLDHWIFCLKWERFWDRRHEYLLNFFERLPGHWDIDWVASGGGDVDAEGNLVGADRGCFADVALEACVIGAGFNRFLDVASYFHAFHAIFGDV